MTSPPTTSPVTGTRRIAVALLGLTITRARLGKAGAHIGNDAPDILACELVLECGHLRFELHAAIWAVLRDEVLKGYAQQLQAVAA